MPDANHLSGPLRKRKFTSTGSKGHCLCFVIGGFRSVLWVSVFQGSLLVILLWPKPDVNIPNIFDKFHPWTSNFQISMRQKYWRFRVTFEIVTVSCYRSLLHICVKTSVAITLFGPRPNNNSFLLEKVKEEIKEIEMISRYLELIRLSLR